MNQPPCPSTSTPLAASVTCPSCSMQAARSDRRQLVPVILDDPQLVEVELRRCRNCQATIDLTAPEPRVLSSL